MPFSDSLAGSLAVMPSPPSAPFQPRVCVCFRLALSPGPTGAEVCPSPPSALPGTGVSLAEAPQTFSVLRTACAAGILHSISQMRKSRLREAVTCPDHIADKPYDDLPNERPFLAPHSEPPGCVTLGAAQA